MRTLTVGLVYSHRSATRKEIAVPCLRLQGIWLEKLGFDIGDKVQVLESPGEIIIRLAEEPPCV